MYAELQQSKQRDRNFSNANRLAASLLNAVNPGDFSLPRDQLEKTNSALARFLDELDADIAKHSKKIGRSSTSK